MLKNSNPITINIHVHQTADEEQPKVVVRYNEYEELESVSDSWDYEDLYDLGPKGRHYPEFSDEKREDATRFNKDFFLGYKFETCFSDYKGIQLRDLRREVAAKCIREIVDALQHLPVPPCDIIEHDDVVFANWSIPIDRRFLPLSKQEFHQIWDNFLTTLRTIGISTPRKCEDLELSTLDEMEEEKCHYYDRMKPVLDFDRMCGLRISVTDPSTFVPCQNSSNKKS